MPKSDLVEMMAQAMADAAVQSFRREFTLSDKEEQAMISFATMLPQGKDEPAYDYLLRLFKLMRAMKKQG